MALQKLPSHTKAILTKKAYQSLIKKLTKQKSHPTPSGYSLKSVCVEIAQTTSSLHIREYAKRGQRIKLVSVKPLGIETTKDLVGTT